MKPSEYFKDWYTSADVAKTYYGGMTDEEAVMFNKIIALLEAVEEADLAGAISMSIFCVSGKSGTMMNADHILSPMIALGGSK